jgi:hypothetical protein
MAEKKGVVPLTTEMRLREHSGDEATLHDVPVSVMQALYHELTGRTETLSRAFKDNYIFAQSDIISLAEKMLQSLHNTTLRPPTLNLKLATY